jgi:hypothetical protein
MVRLRLTAEFASCAGAEQHTLGELELHGWQASASCGAPSHGMSVVQVPSYSTRLQAQINRDFLILLVAGGCLQRLTSAFSYCTILHLHTQLSPVRHDKKTCIQYRVKTTVMRRRPTPASSSTTVLRATPLSYRRCIRLLLRYPNYIHLHPV